MSDSALDIMRSAESAMAQWHCHLCGVVKPGLCAQRGRGTQTARIKVRSQAPECFGQRRMGPKAVLVYVSSMTYVNSDAKLVAVEPEHRWTLPIHVTVSAVP